MTRELPSQGLCNLRPGLTKPEKGGTSLHPAATVDFDIYPDIVVPRLPSSEPSNQLLETLIPCS